ncbi:MAG: hypothetical protein Q9162_006889 [Coniocarpon cinnabarinum]
MSTRWNTLISKCFQQRVKPSRFASYVSILGRDEDISSARVCGLILGRIRPKDANVDPLVITYLESLLNGGQVKPQDLLQALLDARQSAQPSENRDAISETALRLSIDCNLDRALFMSLADGFAEDGYQLQSEGHMHLFKVLQAWMNAFVAQGDDMVSGQEALNPLAEALPPFTALMAQTDVHLTERLHLLARELPALQPSESNKFHQVNDADQDIGQARLGSIIDSEPTNTRASFLVHLDGLLDGRPNASSSQLWGYVQTRYKVSVRGDHFILRSFIINQAPSIIFLLASTGFGPMNCEVLLSQAFSRFEPSLFTSLPQASFLGPQTTVPFEVKQQFLMSCVLCGVISADSVERILGEPASSSVPFEGRLNVQQLVEECRSDSQKLEQLIDKTAALDGNASSRTEALSQIFQKICEHQPVYDEFSACVLLLLALGYRFKLSPTELGLPMDVPLWYPLLHGKVSAMPISALDEDQNKRLSGWIGGLFESNILGEDILASCPPQEFYMLLPTILQQTIMACRLDALERSHLHNGLELLLESFLMPALIPSLLWLTNHAKEHSDAENIYFQILLKVINPQSLNGDAHGMHATMLGILAQPLSALLRGIKERKPSKEIELLIEKLQRPSPYTRGDVGLTRQSTSSFENNDDGGVRNLRANFAALCFWSTNSAMPSSAPSYSCSYVKAAIELEGARTVLGGVVDEINVQVNSGLGDAAFDIGTAIVVSNYITELSSQPNHLTLRDALQLELADAAHVLADNEADHSRPIACVRLSRRVETLLANIAAASAEHEQQQALQMPIPDTIMPDIGLDPETAAAVGLGAENAVATGADASVAAPLDFDPSNTDELSLNIDAALAEQAQQNAADPGQLGDGQLPSADDDIFGDLNVEDYNF